MKLKRWVVNLLYVVITFSVLIILSESEDVIFFIVSHIIAIFTLTYSMYLLDEYGSSERGDK